LSHTLRRRGVPRDQLLADLIEAEALNTEGSDT
jgi:hypothetical protein